MKQKKVEPVFTSSTVLRLTHKEGMVPADKFNRRTQGFLSSINPVRGTFQ